MLTHNIQCVRAGRPPAAPRLSPCATPPPPLRRPCRLGTATPFTDGSNTGGGCGGHAFSRDGFNWTYSPVVAYNSSLVWADGRVVDYGRERPKMFLDGFGNPWVLYNAMADTCCGNVGPLNDDHTWTGAVPLPTPAPVQADAAAAARLAARREARRSGPACAWARETGLAASG